MEAVVTSETLVTYETTRYSEGKTAGPCKKSLAFCESMRNPDGEARNSPRNVGNILKIYTLPRRWKHGVTPKHWYHQTLRGTSRWRCPSDVLRNVTTYDTTRRHIRYNNLNFQRFENFESYPPNNFFEFVRDLCSMLNIYVRNRVTVNEQCCSDEMWYSIMW